MTIEPLKERELLLNSLRQQIEAEAGKRLIQLKLEFRDNHIFVFASADCYYDAQLALLAIQEFMIEKPQIQPIEIVFEIDGNVMGMPS